MPDCDPALLQLPLDHPCDVLGHLHRRGRNAGHGLAILPQNQGQIASPGDAGEDFGLERIEADIEPLHTGIPEPLRHLLQQKPVGGQHQFLEQRHCRRSLLGLDGG